MSKIALAFFLFAILFAATAAAQDNSCAVKMNVTRSDSETLIEGASATAVGKETKKAYRSVLKDGQPYFNSLPQGNYRVYVRKAGYMRSANDFWLDCSEANADDSWNIELYRGNPKLTVKIYNRPPDRIEVVREIVPVRREVKTILGDSDIAVPPTDAPAAPITTSRIPTIVSGGVVNSKSTNLVKPAYPAAARAVRASGTVNVQVTIDEEGKVISASAVSGHPLLRGAAETAAKASSFSPTFLAGRPVKVTGIIVYNFVLPGEQNR